MIPKTELIKALREMIEDYFQSPDFLAYTRYELENYQPPLNCTPVEAQMRRIEREVKKEAA